MNHELGSAVALRQTFSHILDPGADSIDLFCPNCGLNAPYRVEDDRRFPFIAARFEFLVFLLQLPEELLIASGLRRLRPPPDAIRGSLVEFGMSFEKFRDLWHLVLSLDILLFPFRQIGDIPKKPKILGKCIEIPG